MGLSDRPLMHLSAIAHFHDRAASATYPKISANPRNSEVDNLYRLPCFTSEEQAKYFALSLREVAVTNPLQQLTS